MAAPGRLDIWVDCSYNLIAGPGSASQSPDMEWNGYRWVGCSGGADTTANMILSNLIVTSELSNPGA